jgi:hypothetical protein
MSRRAEGPAAFKGPKPMNSMISRAAAVAAVFALAPSAALACACGCGVFDIGSGGMMPTDSTSPLTVWFRYDEMNQNQNWEGGSKAPAADNSDKRIETSFYTVGGQYMVNHSWTVMAELPLYDRALTTTDDGSVFGAAGSIYTGRLTALGDLQLSVVYTGLSADMSTGLGLGVKLPTGDFTGPKGPLGGAEFDRDSLPGTGTTDLILSAYHVGRLNAAGSLSYFVQGRYQFAIGSRDGYRPGNEFDSAAGVTYNFGKVGMLDKVAPVIQLLNSYRDHDSGVAADPPNSGYERLLIAPGVDLRLNKVHLYADVEIPLYQHANAAEGEAAVVDGTSGQLVASVLYKLRVAYDF